MFLKGGFNLKRHYEKLIWEESDFWADFESSFLQMMCCTNDSSDYYSSTESMSTLPRDQLAKIEEEPGGIKFG